MRLASTLLIAVATAAPSPAPSPSPFPRPDTAVIAEPRREGQLTNVRLDIKVTEKRGGTEPVAKLVSMTVADTEQGLIRSVAEVQQGIASTSVPFHVDARPTIEGNKIRLRISLDYTMADRPAEAGGRALLLGVKQALSVVLENGRPMLIADAADPVSDRHVQVEVTATILR